MKDCLGNEVDYCITFDEFAEDRDYRKRGHDFTSEGFLYDEGGSWGFPDCPVGFKTKRDLNLYKSWLSEDWNKKGIMISF